MAALAQSAIKFFLFITLISCSILGEEYYSFQFTKFDCVKNSKYIANITCEIHKNNQSLYMATDTVQNLFIDKIFYIFTMFHRDGQKMKYKPLWGTRNVSVDYCRYARGIGVSMAADLIFKAGDSNVTTQACPYTGHYSLVFGTDKKKVDFPRVFPAGDFLFENMHLSSMYGKREVVWKMHIEGRVQQSAFKAG